MAAVYNAEKRKGNGYKYSISIMLLKTHVFLIALQETQKGFREKTMNFFRLKWLFTENLDGWLFFLIGLLLLNLETSFYL